MTSRVLETFDDAMLMGTCAGPAERPVMSESPALPRVANSLHLPHEKGLKAAKGALMAISMEAAAAFCLIGVWQVWRLLR